MDVRGWLLPPFLRAPSAGIGMGILGLKSERGAVAGLVWFLLVPI